MEEPKSKGRNVENIISMENNEHLIAIIVGVIVILLTLGLFMLWRRGKHARRSVLLMGLCDSGKTLIFSRVLENMFVMTHTSMKENVGDFASKNGSLRLVDVPGHERIRNKFFDQYKSSARGIIYVIDSVNIQKELRDVAEFLYNLLTDSVVNSHCVPLAIVCNKQDQTLAKGSTVVRTLLEKEMNMLRVTKTNQLRSTVDASNNNTFLGKQGKDFNFEHLNPIKVEFFESSALNKNPDNPPDVDSIVAWLNKVA
ncbi:signal recognition particle receptor subunit beta [Ischnura elegans]|uniref:signal recognition particle receptor subunit beta n=1 Tax=Ischnura elegans TaxID=197161 RepID=UPI001ED87852|nr:signal recognition particle receptor subunit beta [Ischnura elegans]